MNNICCNLQRTVPCFSQPAKVKLPKIPLFLLRNGVGTTKALHLIKGIVSRTRHGPEVEIKFDHLKYKSDLIDQFLKFDVTSRPPFDTNPLNSCQLEKLKEFVAEDSNQFWADFLKKVSRPNCTRMDFDDIDWNLLNHINITLIQEHFENLTNLFNTDLLDEAQDAFMSHFNIDYKESILSEILAKSLAYAHMHNGDSIFLPVKDADGKYQLMSYNVETANVGDALHCYVLESSEHEAHPWFIARGTDMQRGLSKGFESFLADVIDHRGLAEDAVIKAMFHKHSSRHDGQDVENLSLIERFEKWGREGRKINLTGHSLGGYIVSDITVRFAPYIRKTYSFNGTGVSKELARKWKKYLEQSPEAHYKLVNFSCEGDFVSSAGKKLIGNQVAVTLTPQPSLNDPVHMHLKLLLNGNIKVQRVDTKNENKKKSRVISEVARSTFGKLLHKAIDTYDKNLLPDWWLQRDHYRKRLQEYEAANYFLTFSKEENTSSKLRSSGE